MKDTHIIQVQTINMSDLAKNVEFLKAAFKGYDLNSDGRVTVKEFRRIMIRTGIPGNLFFIGIMPNLSGKMSDGDIEKMIEKADVDNDGCIDFKEFKKMFED